MSLAGFFFQLPHQKLLYNERIYGCESDLVNVPTGRDKPPTCEAIPVGVWPSPIVTTIETVDLVRSDIIEIIISRVRSCQSATHRMLKWEVRTLAATTAKPATRVPVSHWTRPTIALGRKISRNSFMQVVLLGRKTLPKLF